MRLFGIDPGSAKLGFGVVDLESGVFRLIDQGVIQANRRLPFDRRLLKIHAELTETIKRHAPEVVVIEDVFYGRNARTSMKIGECRGVALLAAAQAGVAIAEYASRDVKKAVVGHGGAGKEQVQWMISRQFGLRTEDLGEDAADALALCLAHGQRLIIHHAHGR